ncbi:putative mitochondrial carrier domain superfamily [Helianthus annuus]|nr:putative mitochondrial carrier domain superfamily [Helianthus annuus]
MGSKGFVEGGIASIVVGCSTHPLNLIKVRMQLQGESAFALPVSNPSLCPAFAYKGVGSTVTMPHAPPQVASVAKSGPVSVGLKIYQTEGVSALFSCISATVLRQTLYSTTRMGLYEIFRNKWTDEATGTFPLTRKITDGLLAGGIGAAMGNPADVAMVRMQADGRLPVVRTIF